MTLENLSPSIFSCGSHRQNCRAISSSSVFTREYVDSGRGAYSSSIGAYGGGVSNGSPRTVSLDAQTTFLTPADRAAAKTLYVEGAFLAKVAALLRRPGAGIAARWTTACAGPCSSTPVSAS